MAYKVVFTNNAERQFRKLDGNTAARIIAKIEALALAPCKMTGIKQLQGAIKGISRVRVGDYRILYQLQDDLFTILVVDIRDRERSIRLNAKRTKDAKRTNHQ